MTVAAAVAKVQALPTGTFRGMAHGRIYIVSISRFAGRRAVKLVAEALDGSDYISLNLYNLAAGPRLKPCEMPLEKVVNFLSDLRPTK